MTHKTYYIHYTLKNNCAHMTTVQGTLAQAIGVANDFKIKHWAIFDRDTWNTSESDGLVAFSTTNPYWTSVAKTITSLKEIQY